MLESGATTSSLPPTRGTGALQAIVRMSATKTNCWAGHIADITTCLGLIGAALWYDHDHPARALLTVLLGLMIFSFVEYAFHRWLFHGPVRIMEQGHTLHHERPLGFDSLPFFLAPLIVLGMAALLALILPLASALLLSGAIALGYAIYGLSHLIVHRHRFHHPLARKWAAVHNIHHFHPDKNFGVTSPLWDLLLGTWYVSKSKVRAR